MSLCCSLSQFSEVCIERRVNIKQILIENLKVFFLSLIKISVVLTSGNLNDLLPYNQYDKIHWPHFPLASVLKSLSEVKNKRCSQKRKKSLKRPKNGKGAV